jgi:N-acetylneuraminic acid mutarotase
MKKLTILFSIFISIHLSAQTAWTWTVVDTMPAPFSNNAVTHASINGEPFVFSFGGINTSKIYSGITLRSFKYDVNGDSWSEIAPLPSGQPRIASAASTVKNKIYIIGGYSVSGNGSETSSNKVVVYNPTTNSYESDGTPIPTPIDDHVQSVWRDSLIYVITGWSNFSNVSNVQIYNPSNDSWTSGTPLPSSTDYKVFGGAGTIIGDTIYYFGGAVSVGNFYATKKLRKGIIDPNDPTNITWTIEDDGPNNSYRSACLSYGNKVFWGGGSATSYNYDGIAYNGTGGVSPLTQIMSYDSYTNQWYAGNGAPYSVMDLRGVAKITPTSWVICGGMNENQQVTNRTFLLTYDPITGGINSNDNKTSIYIYNREIISDVPYKKAVLYNLSGKEIEIINSDESLIKTQAKGLFILKITLTNNEVKNLKINL